MRVVIVGAGSFIGRAIAKLFDEQRTEWEIVLADIQFGSDVLERSEEGVHLDIRDQDATKSLLANADIVVLVAAALSTSFDTDPRAAIDTNVFGALNVVEGAAQAGARLIFSSSCGVYGQVLPGKTVTEETESRLAAAPVNVAAYGAAKLLIESACELYRGVHPRFSWAALRYPTVYGPGQHRRAVHSLNIVDNAERMSRGEALVFTGDPREGHDYVHARDVALANYLAATAPVEQVNRPFVVASGKTITTRDLADLFALVAGYHGEIHWASVPEDRHRLHRIDLTFDVSAARDFLGYTPAVSLERGIRESLDHAQLLSAE